jgi:hypothetical protein
MKKTQVALKLAIALYFLLALGVQPINIAKANPISIPSVPSIQISYPLNSTGGYVNSTVEFEVSVNTLIESPTINSISYSLDGQSSVNLKDLKTTTFHDFGPSKIDFQTYTSNILLKDLSEGNHTLAASANGMCASETFTVNSYYHITALNVLSPNSQIYNSKTVPLRFTYTGEIKNAHYYLYKGGDLVSQKSLSGDTTLGNLSDGSYDLYLYVTTQYGQDAKTVHFSVISISTIVGATALLIFSLAIGLLVYYKLNRKKSSSTVTPAIT